MFNRNKKKLGELLVDAGLINKEQLDHMLIKQKTTGRKLGELLIEDGIVDERQIIEILEFQLKIPIIDFSSFTIDPAVPRLISESLARRHALIPVLKESNQLTVAMSDPMNLYSIDDVNIATGLSVKPAIAIKKDILSAIDQYYGKESAEKAVEDFAKEYDIEQISDIDAEILNEINNAPVVRLVNSFIQHAVKAKASDIHIAL